MDLRLFQVDAFSSEIFAGNPAAVCPLEAWLPDATMQSIALENNLSETAFIVPRGDDFEIRWFTPEVEVDLCGHATLASAWVVLNRLQPKRASVRFHSASGPLDVVRQGDDLTMDFPACPAAPADPPGELIAGLGREPLEVYEAKNWLAVFATEREVRELGPRFDPLAKLSGGVIATAPGDSVDFVSRFFAPGFGVPEDPVTGSAHCTLTPYWAERLGKQRLVARQISKRGGELVCEAAGDRTLLSGRGVLYLEGTVHLAGDEG